MSGAILWVSKQNDSTTLQSIYSLHRWPPHQRGRNEICRRIVRSLLTNCLEMLVLGTTWTSWHLVVREQSCKISHKNGLRHVTNDWQGWFPIFITRMTIVNIVMRETRHSTADRVYSRTQTLLATLRTQNQPQVVSSVFLEVVLLSQSVGCSRNKLRFRTVLQNLKSFHWMLDYVRMGYLLLIFGTLWLKFYIQPKIKVNHNILAPRKLGQFLFPKPRPNMSQENRRLTNPVRWITYLPTRILLKESLICTSLKTTKQWSKWS